MTPRSDEPRRCAGVAAAPAPPCGWPSSFPVAPPPSGPPEPAGTLVTIAHVCERRRTY
ncbi:hypothetical protein KCP70_13170 [Salmonella enterica subsp. enterica]|nr:hypothetical protein KCP70_13170 [Salmonella enterica subsp. enterica]